MARPKKSGNHYTDKTNVIVAALYDGGPAYAVTNPDGSIIHGIPANDGEPVHEYFSGTIPNSGSVDLSYTVPVGKVFHWHALEFTASGDFKAELKKNGAIFLVRFRTNRREDQDWRAIDRTPVILGAGDIASVTFSDQQLGVSDFDGYATFIGVLYDA